MAKRKIKLENLVEEQSTQSLPLSGIGDIIASVTTALGIEKCDGCESRQRALNNLFPFLHLSRPYTNDEIDFIIKITSTNTLQNDDVNYLFALYNSVFPSRNILKRCNCPGLISTMITRLDAFIVRG